jgi:signal transduction histidine kinase
MPSAPVRSLFLKVVIPIIALVLTSMGAVSFFAMRAMGDSVRLVAEERAQYELTEVQDRILDVMQRRSADHGRQLQKALEHLGDSPDVDAVRILSESGRVLYASKGAEVGLVMPVHVSGSPASTSHEAPWTILKNGTNVMHAASPILNRARCSPCHADDPDVLAFIDVDISLSRQSAGMRTWGAMATTTAVVQFVIIGLGIALILSYVVVRPLTRLSTSMQQVQHGNLDVTAVPSDTAEIDGLVEGFNDMVARLRRAREVEEDARRKHLTRVEQLAALGEMAASLAHEIRNPLSGTKAAVDVLAAEEKEEEPRRILRHVSQELARVDGVVRQLLSFAKPKTPVPAEVDVRTLIDNAVMLSGPTATAQEASLDVRASSEPPLALADADMVQQVIVNLLINALQALEGVSGATVVLSTSVRDGEVACSVRDNGPGIPADRAETIFRPFMTTKARGTGLGLATSRRLIELQGGELWLENPGEPGACFTFTLPALTQPAEAGA